MRIKAIIDFRNESVQDRPEDWGKTAGFTMIGLEVESSALTMGDLTDKIATTEAHLSRLTGMKVQIKTEVA